MQQYSAPETEMSQLIDSHVGTESPAENDSLQKNLRR